MRGKSGGPVLLYATAMMIYGTIGIFRRLIPLSSGMLACVRGLIGGCFLLGWIRLRGGRLRLGSERRTLPLLILSGAMIGFNWILLFEAYNYTSVAVATLCYYMEPTFLILAAPLLLGERMTPLKGLCAAVSLLGMVLISGILGSDTLGKRDVTGILLGLGAAVLYTAVVIVNKKTPVADASSKTVVQLFSAAGVLIPYLMLTERWSDISLTPAAVLLTLFVGIVHTGIAYALYFGSMEKLPAQAVAVMAYIDPVLALILSALVLGEAMLPLQLAGAVLIIGAALVSQVFPRQKA